MDTLRLKPAPARPQVLVVEDDEDAAYTLQAQLRQFCEPRVALNGVEAMDILAQGYAPDLVLTDIKMPRQDGISLFNALRSHPATAKVPVLFITGLPIQDKLLKALGLDPGDCIPKPYEPENLLRRVQEALARPAASSSPSLHSVMAQVAEWKASLERQYPEPRTPEVEALLADLERAVDRISKKLPG